MTMEQKIKSLLIEHSASLFGMDVSESMIQFQPTRKDVDGDLTLVVFPFVKLLKCNPEAAGNKIGAFLEEHLDEILSYEALKGFLNLSLKDSYWLEQLSQCSKDGYGLAEPKSKPLVMVEYSSPNTNKPLHLGHLRNIFLGDAVASILEANGHSVIRTQIINDRGIHICKSMIAWEKFSPLNPIGERETPDNTGLKGDKLVGKYYVAFDQQLNIEAASILDAWSGGTIDSQIKEEVEKLQAIREGKKEEQKVAIDAKLKELAKSQSPLMKEAKDMLIKWEARDPQVYLLWSTMNGWVYKGFEHTYETMGVSFDKLYYESDTYALGKDVVQEGLQKKVFYKKEDGSVWIDLTDDGLDEKIVLRSDGTAVYMTQDIGTAIDRFKDFPEIDGMVYTVGNEQDYHFKVLFLILKKLGYAWADNCHHLSYGMVDLPSGKMKSREGTVVDADDLMADVIDAARIMTQERGHLDDMSSEEKDLLYHQIGMSGLKYYLLKVDPKKRMMFNPKESIDLNGNTGPFIQYTYARICSLLKKAGTFNPQVSENTTLIKSEKEVIKHLSRYSIAINDASKSYTPSTISAYCYELVKLYNQFYQNVKILPETDDSIRSNRLVLSKSVASVIEKSLEIFGIHSPKRM
ncbi:MAG: arginine--tRNA ligase [Crocinitomicaceae bacterium]